MSATKQRIQSALTRLVEGHHIPGGYGGRVDLPPTDDAAVEPFAYLQACLQTTFLAFLDHPRFASFRLPSLRLARSARPDGEPADLADLVETEVDRMLALLPAPLRLAAEGEGEAVGWEYGTPPGLSQDEWPRHETTGMPLAHGFTVRVPEAYRAKGPAYVALSFFHPADTEACGGENDRVAAVLAGEALDEDEEDDPYFLALTRHLGARETPSPDRIVETFVDMLGHTHALVWHTEASASAPRCDRPTEQPPEGIDVEAFIEADEPASPLFATTKRHRIQFGRPLHPMQSHGALNEMGLLVLELKTGVGGVNFGDGTGQIDLETGVLDWAC